MKNNEMNLNNGTLVAGCVVENKKEAKAMIHALEEVYEVKPTAKKASAKKASAKKPTAKKTVKVKVEVKDSASKSSKANASSKGKRVQHMVVADKTVNTLERSLHDLYLAANKRVALPRREEEATSYAQSTVKRLMKSMEKTKGMKFRVEEASTKKTNRK